MKKYFTAKSDLIFQQALCLEKDKDVLSWFIGKLFNQKVTDLIIKTPVLPIGKTVEKQNTVDLLVTFEDKTVNLEVNSCHYKYLNERNFCYITSVYNSEFKKDAPKHLLMLDFGGKELEKLCKGDKMMEKFKENVERLNDDKTVINFLTDEEETRLKIEAYMREGYENGVEAGEKETKLDLAKKMIAKKIKLEDISEITGLSIDELKKL